MQALENPRGKIHAKTGTKKPALRRVAKGPAALQSGRGHQLWRAVLGNPIPIKSYVGNEYAVILTPASLPECNFLFPPC